MIHFYIADDDDDKWLAVETEDEPSDTPITIYMYGHQYYFTKEETKQLVVGLTEAIKSLPK